MASAEPGGRRMCNGTCRICGAVLAAVPGAATPDSVSVPTDAVWEAHPRLGGDATPELMGTVFEAVADELLAHCRVGFDGAPTFLAGLEQAHVRIAGALLAHPDVARFLVAPRRDRGLLEAAQRYRARLTAFLIERREALDAPPVPPLQLEMLVGSLSLHLARVIDDPTFVGRDAAAIAAELMTTARVFEPSALSLPAAAVGADAMAGHQAA